MKEEKSVHPAIAQYLLDSMPTSLSEKQPSAGVVSWPEPDEIMQMAFEEGQPSEDASGYYFELEEFDLFIQRLLDEVARLNASRDAVAVPEGWREFIEDCATTAGGMVNGNRLSHRAAELLAAAPTLER